MDIKNVLSREKAVEKLGGDENIYREIRKIFFKEYHDAMDTIKQAVKEMNLPVLRQTAHSFKTSAGTIGADEIMQLAHQNEALAK